MQAEQTEQTIRITDAKGVEHEIKFRSADIDNVGLEWDSSRREVAWTYGIVWHLTADGKEMELAYCDYEYDDRRDTFGALIGSDLSDGEWDRVTDWLDGQPQPLDRMHDEHLRAVAREVTGISDRHITEVDGADDSTDSIHVYIDGKTYLLDAQEAVLASENLNGWSEHCEAPEYTWRREHARLIRRLTAADDTDEEEDDEEDEE